MTAQTKAKVVEWAKQDLQSAKDSYESVRHSAYIIRETWRGENAVAYWRNAVDQAEAVLAELEAL